MRLRREVLPLLDEVLGGGVRAALARTAELMAQDLQALDEIAATVLAAGVAGRRGTRRAGLGEQPAAVIGPGAAGLGGGRWRGPLTFEQLAGW